MPLNMNQQYRAEVRTMKQARNKVLADYKRALRQLDRESQQHTAAIRRIGREMVRTEKRADKSVLKINNRILVLQGRLA